MPHRRNGWLGVALVLAIAVSAAVAQTDPWKPANLGVVQGAWRDISRDETSCFNMIAQTATSVSFYFPDADKNYTANFDFSAAAASTLMQGNDPAAYPMSYFVSPDDTRNMYVAKTPGAPTPVGPGPDVDTYTFRPCGFSELDVLGAVMGDDGKLGDAPVGALRKALRSGAGLGHEVVQTRRPVTTEIDAQAPLDKNALEFRLSMSSDVFFEVWNLTTSRGVRRGGQQHINEAFVFGKQPDGSVMLAFRLNPADGIPPSLELARTDQRYEKLFRITEIPTGLYSYAPDYFIGPPEEWSCSNRAMQADGSVNFTVPGPAGAGGITCMQIASDTIPNAGTETCQGPSGDAITLGFSYSFNNDGSVTYLISKTADIPYANTHPLSQMIAVNYAFPCMPVFALSGSWRDVSPTLGSGNRPSGSLSRRGNDGLTGPDSNTPCSVIVPQGLPSAAGKGLFYLTGAATPAEFTLNTDLNAGVLRRIIPGATSAQGGPVFNSTTFVFRFNKRNKLTMIHNTCPIGSTDCDSSTPVFPSSSSPSEDASDLPKPVETIIFERCDVETLDPLLGVFRSELGTAFTALASNDEATRTFRSDEGYLLRQELDLANEVGIVDGNPGSSFVRFGFSHMGVYYETANEFLDSRDAASKGNVLRRYEPGTSAAAYMTGDWLHSELESCSKHALTSSNIYASSFNAFPLGGPAAASYTVEPTCTIYPLKRASGGVLSCQTASDVEVDRFFLPARIRPLDTVLLRFTGEVFTPNDVDAGMGDMIGWQPCFSQNFDASILRGPSWRTAIDWKDFQSADSFDEVAGTVIETGLDRLAGSVTYFKLEVAEQLEPELTETNPYPSKYIIGFSAPVEVRGNCQFTLDARTNKGKFLCPAAEPCPFYYRVTNSGVFLARYQIACGAYPVTAAEGSPGTGLLIFTRGVAEAALLTSGARRVVLRSPETNTYLVRTYNMSVVGRNSVRMLTADEELITFFADGRASVTLPKEQMARQGTYAIASRSTIEIAYANKHGDTPDWVGSPNANTILISFPNMDSAPPPFIGRWTLNASTPLDKCMNFRQGPRAVGVYESRQQSAARGDVFAASLPGVGSAVDSPTLPLGVSGRLFAYSSVSGDGFMHFAVNRLEGRYQPAYPSSVDGSLRSTYEKYIPCIEKVDVSFVATANPPLGSASTFGAVDLAVLLDEDIAQAVYVDPRFITSRSFSAVGGSDPSTARVTFSVSNAYYTSADDVMARLYNNIPATTKRGFTIDLDSVSLDKSSFVPFPPVPPGPDPGPTPIPSDPGNGGIIAAAIIVPLVVLGVAAWYFFWYRRRNAGNSYDDIPIYSNRGGNSEMNSIADAYTV